ncbi:hypothetical protein KBI23_23655 [bacterium]|nr:hypothetical protein [bacterium]MBP9810202.1 hypothetical protein [bacterium]
MSKQEQSKQEKSEQSKSELDKPEQVLLNRCPQCAAAIYEAANNCPLCQAELLGSFAINQDLIEESVENLIALLRAEYDVKSLRLAEDSDQLMARAKIREMVREDATVLTIFERGIVLQHLLNIIFNSKDEENL